MRNSRGAAVRIFYPAVRPPEDMLDVPLFRNRLPFFVEGYLHTFGCMFLPSIIVKIIYQILHPILLILPLNHTNIPRCTFGAPPQTKTESALPLVVWSHGLTGTGCEHGLLAATLALSGCVVALPHHSDGSSSMTDIGEARYVRAHGPMPTRAVVVLVGSVGLLVFELLPASGRSVPMARASCSTTNSFLSLAGRSSSTSSPTTRTTTARFGRSRRSIARRRWRRPGSCA